MKKNIIERNEKGVGEFAGSKIPLFVRTHFSFILQSSFFGP